MKQCGQNDHDTMTILNESTLFLDTHVCKYHTETLSTFMTIDLRAILVGENEKDRENSDN